MNSVDSYFNNMSGDPYVAKMVLKTSYQDIVTHNGSNFLFIYIIAIQNYVLGSVGSKLALILAQSYFVFKIITKSKCRNMFYIFLVIFNPIELYFLCGHNKETYINFIFVVCVWFEMKRKVIAKYLFLGLVNFVRPLTFVLALFERLVQNFGYIYVALTAGLLSVLTLIGYGSDFVADSVKGSGTYDFLYSMPYVGQSIVIAYGLLAPLPYVAEYSFTGFMFALYGFLYYIIAIFIIKNRLFRNPYVIGFIQINILTSFLVAGSFTKARFIAPFFIALVLRLLKYIK